jgi:hypothetical protein
MIVWKVSRLSVDPAFADDIDALLMPDAAFWVVTFGRRTREVQAGLYATWLLWLDQHAGEDPRNGPRAAPPGSSAHEYGLAIDLTLVVNGKDDWNYKNTDWRRLVAAVKAHPRLHSLDSIGDTDHIECLHWRQHIQP